jgi:oligopeptide transport system substrate-binding protein
LKPRNSTWLFLILAVVLAGVLMAVAACGGGGATTTTAASGEKPVQGGTLSVHSGEISFIDPAVAFESEGVQVDNAIFDSLTQFDYNTLETKPDVATSWDTNAEGTVYTFHLKKGTKFHNGREVVAADFKYAWERLSNPANKSNYAFLLSMVKGYDEMQAETNPATELSGVKALDNYTLEVTLSSPFAEFPIMVGMWNCAPVPKEEVEKDPKAFAAMPIGNGPFKMVEPWVAGQGVKVVRFEEYTGTKPNIEGINFREYSDVNTAFLDFQAGTIDWCQIPTGQYKATAAKYGRADDGFTANPGKQVQDGTELGIVELLMNNQDALFKNADLRRAVSLAINRQAICDTAWEGLRKPADNIIPSSVPGYEANAWPYSHYDLQAAKDMLAKAGYPGGQGLPTIKLSFNTGGDHETWMQLVQADLKAIGINTEFDSSDGPTYWGKVGKGEYQIGRSGWFSDYPTIDDYLTPLLYSTSGQNFDQYKNPAMDKAIDAARTIIDDSERMKAQQAVVKAIGEECPEAPIATYAHHHVTTARVHNLIYSAMGILDFVSCWVTQ